MIIISDAGVVGRRYLHQLLFYFVADLKAGHKVVDAFLCNCFVGAGKGLESLIGMRLSLSAQDSLYCLSYHGPLVIEVGVNALSVEQ